MNARLILSHVCAALLGLGLGYGVLSAGSHAGPRVLPRFADPVASFAEAAHVEDAHARAQALLDFFASADPSWAERLRDEISKPGSDLVLDEIGETLFAEWWARTDPEAAFHNPVHPPWPNRHPWIREVVIAWVRTNPIRTAEAVDAIPAGTDLGKVEATRVLIEHWWDDPANSDPGPLLAVVYKLELRTRAAALTRMLEVSMEKRGVDATEKFVESIPVSDSLAMDLRQEVAGRYVQALVDRGEIDRAVRWAEKNGEGRSGIGVLRHLAFSWGLKDGPAAMDWAMNLKDDRQRWDIVLRAWLSFRQGKPDEASAWLMAHEPTETLREVFERYLKGTAGLDAQAALAMANKAKDPKLRERLLTAVGVGWMKSDPEAALAWLETVELAPELEQLVRETTRADARQALTPIPPS